MKIRPVGDKLFHTDGQGDTRKLRAALLYFEKAYKNSFMSKMNKNANLHSEFVDKIDREISVK
jgi:hypothetical protein